MDAMNKQMTSLAAAQDLQNERLTANEQQMADLRSAIGEGMGAIDAKVVDHDARPVNAQGQIDVSKEELAKRASAQADRANREMRLLDE